MRAIAWEAETHTLRSWKTAHAITETPDAIQAERYGAAACFAHRADLLEALARELPSEIITLGARCVSVEAEGDVATARFADGRDAGSPAALNA